MGKRSFKTFFILFDDYETVESDEDAISIKKRANFLKNKEIELNKLQIKLQKAENKLKDAKNKPLKEDQKLSLKMKKCLNLYLSNMLLMKIVQTLN